MHVLLLLRKNPPVRASVIGVFALASLLWANVAVAQDGYHRDIFLDGGYSITSRDHLAAADMLGLSYDALATSDKALQLSTIVGSDSDLNGALLYPDGAPRYRALYVGGGSATGHGRSLGDAGRERMRQFFGAGGSYVGSCAGAFLAMLHNNKADYQADGPYQHYLQLWPGIGQGAGVKQSYHDLIFDDVNHPLVQKYASLIDGSVNHIRHNYGCRFDPDYYTAPVGTEFIGLVDNPQIPKLHGYYNIAAWKESAQTGRAVLSCSHPEDAQSGEKRDLMAAILSYALDGLGDPRPVKAVLQRGEMVQMDSEQTKLGDGQFHYWQLDLPQQVDSLTIDMDGSVEGLELYLQQTRYPTRSRFLSFAVDSQNTSKRIKLSKPASGPWFVGVYGTHTWLNGRAYRIQANWQLEPAAPPTVDAGPQHSPDMGVVGQPYEQPAEPIVGLGGCAVVNSTGSAPLTGSGVCGLALLLVWVLRRQSSATGPETR